MMYKVKKIYGGGAPLPVATFNTPDDAKIFIEAALVTDANRNVKSSYQLYEGMDLLEEFAQSDQSGQAPTSEGGSGGSQQRSSFQPTPFNAAPRPAGMPHNWIKDEDDKKK